MNLYGTVENTLAHVDDITPKRAHDAVAANVKLAKLSKALATIKTD